MLASFMPASAAKLFVILSTKLEVGKIIEVDKNNIVCMQIQYIYCICQCNSGVQCIYKIKYFYKQIWFCERNFTRENVLIEGGGGGG